ncbi:MAG: COP23 domain-containing protein, partial [Cyanobacteria bacterium J06641_5]
ASTSAPEAPASSANSHPPLTFFCSTDGAVPVTALRLAPEAAAEGAPQVHPLLTWTGEYFPVAEQAAQLCQQAAGRLQAYAQQSDPGQFSFITGNVDGLPAICLETAEEFECQADRLLTSLEAGQDAKAVLLSMTPEENHPEVLPSAIPTRGDFPLSINPWPVSITSIMDGLFQR